MEKQTPFRDCHPAVNFVWFALVLLLSMCLMHPISLIISLTGAVLCLCFECGAGELKKLRFLLLPLLLAALINPAFTHKGMTLLCYLPSGNPLTLESILYGLAAALLLAALLLWFRLFSVILTEDKLLWLFGRIAPALSLLFSMILRLLPGLTARLRSTLELEKLHDPDPKQNGKRSAVRRGLTALSAMITFTLENALDTADSMKSRGFGLPGRTAFSIYRLEERDRLLLGWLGFCGLFLLSGWLAGGFEWHYYPTVGGSFGRLSGALWLCHAALVLTPLLLQLAEKRTFMTKRTGEVKG